MSRCGADQSVCGRRFAGDWFADADVAAFACWVLPLAEFGGEPGAGDEHKAGKEREDDEDDGDGERDEDDGGDGGEEHGDAEGAGDEELEG